MKVKNIKKRTWEFPNISRFITETKDKLSWEEKKHFVYIFTFIFLLFIGFMIFDLKQKIVVASDMQSQKQQVLENIHRLEGVVDKYKDYKDGYLELAILEYRLGNITKAKYYLEKVFKIDPNSKVGIALENILREKY
jgi:hypothetical protein